jgi:hypothetical protein
MFVEKKDRQTEQFNLHDAGDLERLRDLMNDPRIVILNRDKITLTESTFDGETTTTRQELNVFVEYETCSL